MNLDEAQKQKVVGWIADGLKLSEIQQKLVGELGLKLTYMEVRFLVDDLKLIPKDPPPAKTADTAAKTVVPGPNTTPAEPEAADELADDLLDEVSPNDQQAVPGIGKVSVVVDKLAHPGAMISGDVTFSDGNAAKWYLDQTGRLGMAPKKQGYRPSQADVQAFQLELQNVLQKMGF